MQKAIVIRKDDLAKVLATPPVQGKHLLPWPDHVVGVPFKVLEDADVENRPEVHDHEEDVWEVLEGTVEFVLNGILVNPIQTKPNEWVGDSIQGGESVILNAGDRLWIPVGCPHVHNKRHGTTRLMITKRLPKSW